MASKGNQVIDVYRRHANTWTNLRGTDMPERKWINRFVSVMPEAPSVLDLGCGSGEPIGRHLVDMSCKVTGIDAAPELIEIAKKRVPEANWLLADMRDFRLDLKFHGILAWNSLFHLSPDEQSHMFSTFKQHALPGTALMFTSGPARGEVMGELGGDPLYHSSLSTKQYANLLKLNGFDVIAHVIEDPECGQHTVWLSRFNVDPP
ncbi:class I SAM-dependent methyltransferase [Roseibium porphyridii]|uniref:Class I SAM-dependent methyltransferase n=1 Tax=Roseibium porphyridii TaxID=2866279 RepID=A0ABY8FB25_9HYPH|nr:class I SAM-dependent methyltransferase [Roseibium sp. KMA01]WFE89823.1 class I SAM-dependent methyltransferase [Roseibium sp. KMA01]